MLSVASPSAFLLAQAPMPYIPSITPPSPNAATLLKFSDVPVSPYTGTADVSIPIYDIKARGIAVPISLNYHTAGIRLKEEAGWVGLGWALSAGGAISRTVMNLDDFAGEYFNHPVPEINGNFIAGPFYPRTGEQLLGVYGYDFYCNDSVYTDQGVKDFSFVFSNAPPPFDTEPDQFSFNFPGHSGKFILARNGAVVLQKQENLQIQYTTGGNSFTIIDDQGNSFYFADKEIMESSTGGPQSISSWYLSRIVTQLSDTVTFNYVTDSTWTQVAGEQFETSRNGCSGLTGMTINTSPPISYLNKTLQSINFSNGQLQFAFDNSRPDLQNGKKLNEISIYSKTAAGTLTHLHDFNLYYSYFNAGVPGNVLELERLRLDSVKEISGAASIPPYSFVYNSLSSGFMTKHGFAVDNWGYYNGAAGNSQFTPGFNGNAYLGTNAPAWVSLSGSNRNPDSTSMKAFSLQQVTYPTGGSTLFDYEPNYYDDAASRTTGTQDFPQYVTVDTSVSPTLTGRGTFTGSIDLSAIFTESSVTNVTMSVTFRSETNANQAIYRNNNGQIYFTFASTNVDMSQTNLDCSSNPSVCTLAADPLMINPVGVYNWTAYINPSIGSDFEGIYVTISWKELYTNHYKTEILMASGLRIRGVTDLNSDGTVAKKRRYDYNYLANNYGWGTRPYTYGKLLSFPSYAHYEEMSVTVPDPGFCTSLTLTSTSLSSVTSVIQGNIVGYTQVAEYIVNPLTNTDIGKTVYSYYNSSDTILNYNGWRFPGSLNMPNNQNGLLLSKIAYSDNGGNYSKVSETDNFYHTTNRIPYWNCKYLLQPNSGNTFSQYCPGGICVANQFIAGFYPSIKSERVLLDSTTDIAYDQSDPTKFVATTQRYYYDNPAHYQVTRLNTSDSKGNSLVSFQKYPQDYIPNGFTVTGNTILDTMIAHNMVTPTIEKVDSLYYPGGGTGNVTGGRLNLYRLLSGSIPIPDKQFQLDLPSPVTNFQAFTISGNSTSQDSRYRQMISFDSYDAVNNLNQYTPTDQLPLSFIWDYSHTYPIAQVKNAVLADVATTSFEADGTGNIYLDNGNTGIVSTDAITGTNSYQINNGLAVFNLNPAKTYVVSLWAKNGTPSYNGYNGSTLVVPTNNVWTTGKTINGWTYLELSMTGVATINVGGGGGLVDEVRFYPANAQMTTFTYSPLVGTTTTCDVDNKVTYYFYDAYQRLIRVKDQDGNIIKTFQYHYANQQPFNQ